MGAVIGDELTSDGIALIQAGTVRTKLEGVGFRRMRKGLEAACKVKSTRPCRRDSEF